VCPDILTIIENAFLGYNEQLKNQLNDIYGRISTYNLIRYVPDMVNIINSNVSNFQQIQEQMPFDKKREIILNNQKVHDNLDMVLETALERFNYSVAPLDGGNIKKKASKKKASKKKTSKKKSQKNTSKKKK